MLSRTIIFFFFAFLPLCALLWWYSPKKRAVRRVRRLALDLFEEHHEEFFHRPGMLAEILSFGDPVILTGNDADDAWEFASYLEASLVCFGDLDSLSICDMGPPKAEPACV